MNPSAKLRKLIMAASMFGAEGFTKLCAEPTKQPKKCLLPDCTELTAHNGGYCSAEHCKKHRELSRQKL